MLTSVHQGNLGFAKRAMLKRLAHVAKDSSGETKMRRAGSRVRGENSVGLRGEGIGEDRLENTDSKTKEPEKVQGGCVCEHMRGQ